MSQCADLSLAIRLFAVAPSRFGGFWLRARPGPVRDTTLSAIDAALKNHRLCKLHPNTDDDALFGAADFAQTLATGKLVMRNGLFSTPRQVFLLTMAERADAALCAKLATAIDGKADHALIAADEGAEAEEALHPLLAARLAFHFDLNNELPSGFALPPLSHPAVLAARKRLPRVEVPRDHLKTLVATALGLGITNPAIPIFATLAARVDAAFEDTGEAAPVVAEKHLLTAARLIYAPRATLLAEPDSPDDQPPPPPDAASDPNPDDAQSNTSDGPLQDRMIDAVQAALPQGLLQSLAAQTRLRRATGGGGTGETQRGNRKGRPLPARPGRLTDGKRLDLPATLRRAAPFQSLRAASKPADVAVAIRPDDICTKRFETKSDHLLIFAVDASGSAALSRLAEAKGAIETLLSEAYSRRDHVALITFRGTQADLLLPPTRSIVQAKNRLSLLPGGGGTPLAHGLRESFSLARLARSRGMTPSLILLADGGANIGLDGEPGRKAANEDAQTLAKAIRIDGIKSLVVDISRRGDRNLKTVAQTMDAGYVILPNARSTEIARAVDTALS